MCLDSTAAVISFCISWEDVCYNRGAKDLIPHLLMK